jgi:hypothetical protein
VPELTSLRNLFASKYSKEYAAEAASDVGCSKWQVNVNLIRCLLVSSWSSSEIRVLLGCTRPHVLRQLSQLPCYDLVLRQYVLSRCCGSGVALNVCPLVASCC